MRKLFEQHLPAAVEAYPNLRIVGEPGHQYLRGILDVPDGAGGVACSYMVEITWSSGYPYRYPIVSEIGGDIPAGPDNHKYDDRRLCLSVVAEEILQCRKGLMVSDFIREVLIPHLANQYYHQITGSYLQEYAHGIPGVRQCYDKLLGKTDLAILSGLYKAAFEKSIGRNDSCFCGSGQKFKCCHEPAVKKLQLIGKGQVAHDFKLFGML